MSKKSERRKKLYLIGIDSAPLWLIKEFGHLKGFERFLKQGKMVELESTMPPMTGPSWPSIYTGLHPGEHGVPDFFHMKKEYTPDLAFYDPEEVPPFWENLAKAGYKCLVITPATDVKVQRHKNIDMITGFPFKSKPSSAELEALMKKYNFYGEADIEKEMMSGKLSLEKSSKIYSDGIKVRSKIAKEMMEKHEYDFVYVCFTETDRMQHASLNNPKYKDYLLPIYSEISNFITYVQEMADKEDGIVMVISDHGALPVKDKFLINTFLLDEGFATFKQSVQKDLSDSKEGKAGKMSLRYAIREKLLTTKLRKVYDHMPHQLKKQVFNLSAALFSQISKEDYAHIHLYDLDMSKTKAFAAISNLVVSTIWINDSRFIKGIVSKAEKHKLKSEIIAKLKEVKSKQGDKLFVNVLDADPYYKNTKKFIAPDIFAEVKAGYTVDVKYFSLKSMFMRPEIAKSGDHSKFGIFGVYPSGKVPMGKKELDVTEVMPKIMEYFKVK
ncbi:MAG TPA: alkaline phosphatase family protein [Candidatus Aquilonibacter sp.]|nr:alkaline phosphatase family protein [Candidatus Aquilonibacter sp.]